MATYGSGLMVQGSWLLPTNMAYEKKEYNKVGKKYTTEKKPAYKPKRGALSKLMSEDEKATAGIHELSYDFGCRINYGSRLMING